MQLPPSYKKLESSVGALPMSPSKHSANKSFFRGALAGLLLGCLLTAMIFFAYREIKTIANANIGISEAWAPSNVDEVRAECENCLHDFLRDWGFNLTLPSHRVFSARLADPDYGKEFVGQNPALKRFYSPKYSACGGLRYCYRRSAVIADKCHSVQIFGKIFGVSIEESRLYSATLNKVLDDC